MQCTLLENPENTHQTVNLSPDELVCSLTQTRGSVSLEVSIQQAQHEKPGDSKETVSRSPDELVETREETDNSADIIQQINAKNSEITNKLRAIASLNHDIEALQKQRSAKCFKFHHQHWVQCRESGPYGERYQFCVICKCEV